MEDEIIQAQIVLREYRQFREQDEDLLPDGWYLGHPTSRTPTCDEYARRMNHTLRRYKAFDKVD